MYNCTSPWGGSSSESLTWELLFLLSSFAWPAAWPASSLLYGQLGCWLFFFAAVDTYIAMEMDFLFFCLLSYIRIYVRLIFFFYCSELWFRLNNYELLLLFLLAAYGYRCQRNWKMQVIKLQFSPFVYTHIFESWASLNLNEMSWLHCWLLACRPIDKIRPLALP